jgi:hypothetical protein
MNNGCIISLPKVPERGYILNNAVSNHLLYLNQNKQEDWDSLVDCRTQQKKGLPKDCQSLKVNSVC